MTHESAHIDFDDKAAGYAALARELESLLQGERHPIANAANLAGLLYWALPDINWIGFYFLEDGGFDDGDLDGGDLLVGPFQGKPACVRIPMGRGVCGTAAQRRETIVVEDVHAFPDHIACDSASNSEIVVPLILGGELIGVLDCDSPRKARFDEVDRAGMERIAAIYLASLE